MVKNIAEHEEKIAKVKAAGGNAHSMEVEVMRFKATLAAAQEVLAAVR